MPIRLLDQLDKLAPNAPESALIWRSKCRAHIAAKRKPKTIVKAGDIVRFSPQGRDFELLSPAGPRRGWHVRLVNGDNSIFQYRATARQMNNCIVIS